VRDWQSVRGKKIWILVHHLDAMKPDVVDGWGERCRDKEGEKLRSKVGRWGINGVVSGRSVVVIVLSCHD